MKKIKARIIEIKKDDMQICSSRVIWAKVEDGNGQVYRVAWAQTPVVVGFTGVWRSRAQHAFPSVWNSCEVGDEVNLYHAEDENFNYIEVLN